MLAPEICHVHSIEHITQDVFTLSLENQDGERVRPFLPGQYNMLYLFGFGESAISISGQSSLHEGLVHTIRAVGTVTQGLQRLKRGDVVGVRGPFGVHWPLQANACDVLLIAGGLGLPPLRSALLHFLEHEQQNQTITLLYGARTPSDLLYKTELQKWKERGVDVEVTVDRSENAWQGHVGVVTKLIKEHLPSPDKTIILMCGPEIMMQFALEELMHVQADETKIYLSLERNMQCGVGFCGHCQFGPYFVCKDGPVFPFPAVKKWLSIHEL